jgi:hypothetical protein
LIHQPLRENVVDLVKGRGHESSMATRIEHGQDSWYLFFIGDSLT